MARSFELKFADRELANELRNLKIDDLQVGQKINFTDCADPEVMAASNQMLTFIVTSGSSVALSLFSAWLYDKLKGKKANKSIKINDIEVSGNSNNLKIEIHNYINSSEGD